MTMTIVIAFCAGFLTPLILELTVSAWALHKLDLEEDE